VHMVVLCGLRFLSASSVVHVKVTLFSSLSPSPKAAFLRVSPPSQSSLVPILTFDSSQQQQYLHSSSSIFRRVGKIWWWCCGGEKKSHNE
jgi:hypothetical protein